MSIDVEVDCQQGTLRTEPVCIAYDKSSNGTTNVPPTHKQRICNTTVSGIRNLVDEQRHRGRKASRCTTHKESRQDEPSLVIRTTQPDTQCKEAVAHVYAQFAAIPVGYPRHGQVCDSGASPVDRIDEAEPNARRRVHEFAPLVQSLQAVHQRPVISVCRCCGSQWTGR